MLGRWLTQLDTEGLRKGRRRSIAGDERGAQLVEFALILPILLSFLFGIITGGVAFSHNLQIDNAARETARFGATLPIDGDLPAWLGKVADTAIGASTGSLDDGEAGREICVAYVYPAGSHPHDQTMQLTENAAGVRATANQPCVADSRPATERRVQVVVQRESDLIVFYFTKTLTLSGQAIARFERHNS